MFCFTAKNVFFSSETSVASLCSCNYLGGSESNIFFLHALVILNVDKQDVATVTSHVRHMAVWQFLEIGLP